MRSERLEAAARRERVRRTRPEVAPALAEALGRDAASLAWVEPDRAYGLQGLFGSAREPFRWTQLVSVASRERDVFDAGIAACRRLLPPTGLVLLLFEDGMGIEVKRDEVLDRVDVPIVSEDRDLRIAVPGAGLCLTVEFDTFSGHRPVTYELDLWHDERLVAGDP